MFGPLHLRKINGGYGNRPDHTMELDYSQYLGNQLVQNGASGRDRRNPVSVQAPDFSRRYLSQPEKRGMRRQDPMVWMLADAVELLSRADRLGRQLHRADQAVAVACWEPPVDVYENARGLIVLIALPGVVPERVQVSLEDDFIRVRGDRPVGAGFATGEILRLEIPYGRFERHIRMPAGRYQLADMQLNNGCLKLTIDRLA